MQVVARHETCKRINSLTSPVSHVSESPVSTQLRGTV